MNAERVIKELRRKLQGIDTTCPFGCTHCCQQPVLMTYAEWTEVGRHPGKDLRLTQGCPFLLGIQCSIYQHRPIPCRWHGLADAGENHCPGITLQPGPLPEAVVQDVRRRWTMLLYWQMGQYLVGQRRNPDRQAWFKYCEKIPAAQRIRDRLEPLLSKVPPTKTGVSHKQGAIYATGSR